MTGTGERNRHNDTHQPDAQEAGITVWMARHEWTIVAAIGLLAFILGWIGLYQVMAVGDPDSEYSWWDPAYVSFRLFLFDGPEASQGWPIHLQIARAVAPLVLLYTAAVAIFKQVENEVALYRLHFRKRRFVVVCGIGEVGYRVARDYCLNTDKTVVTIDREADNLVLGRAGDRDPGLGVAPSDRGRAHELSGLGAITLTGNALDTVTLLKCRIMYAKEVFLCTSDDQANISCAKTIERLCRSVSDAEVAQLTQIASKHEIEIAGEPASTGLRAFLCVDAPTCTTCSAIIPSSTSTASVSARGFSTAARPSPAAYSSSARPTCTTCRGVQTPLQ